MRSKDEYLSILGMLPYGESTFENGVIKRSEGECEIIYYNKERDSTENNLREIFTKGISFEINESNMNDVINLVNFMSVNLNDWKISIVNEELWLDKLETKGFGVNGVFCKSSRVYMLALDEGGEIKPYVSIGNEIAEGWKPVSMPGPICLWA